MKRRDFLKCSAGFSAMVLCGSTLGCMTTGNAVDKASGTVRGERLEVPNSNGSDPPSTAAPVGATDCHIHIFDPRFPRAVKLAANVPVWATVADYRLLQRRLGLSRVVVVSPSSYGFDNSCLVNALDTLGDKARGIAVFKIDVPDAELDRLHAHGVRGIRLYIEKGRTKPEELSTFARRISRLGWHIQLVVGRDPNKLVEVERYLTGLSCPLVIDHFGYVPQPDGVRHPGVSVLRRLLDKGNTWIKLSGVYIRSKVGYPTYSDVNELAIDLVRSAPQRILWGTDWPHTGVRDRKVVPDSAMLFDQLAIWSPDENVRRRILVENPQRLYWSA